MIKTHHSRLLLWPRQDFRSRNRRWGNRTTKARHGAFRNIVQAGSAEAFRPRDAVSAFVLVSRVAKGFRGCAEGRSRMRHRLLGHCAQPAVESPRPAAGEESRRGRCRDREGQERRRQDPARARLPRRARRHVRRLREGRPPHPHSGLCQGHGSNWRSAIRTTTRRRSTMRSRSTPRRRRPTRPTPTSSRARRSWSRSRSASRSIPAWRIT